MKEEKNNRFAYESEQGLHKLSEEEYTSLFDKDEPIEKAIKDKSHLRKVKKLIHRDGKVFLSTYYEKTGEREEKEIDEKFVDPLLKDLIDKDLLEVGKKVEIKTKKDSLKGSIQRIEYVPTSDVFRVVLLGTDEKIVWVSVKSINDIKELSEEPIEEPKKTIDPYEIDKSFSEEKFLLGKRLGGSSEVRLCDFDGKKFVVKKQRSAAKAGQLVSEGIADSIYRMCGFHTPISLVLDKDGIKYKISEYIPGKEIGVLEGAEKDAASKELKKGFVLDCLLVNWDVVGVGGDNVLVNGGNVYRIDNGGALAYRAKGELKTVSDTVGELETMKKGPYADITNDEIEEQVKSLLKYSGILKAYFSQLGQPYKGIFLKRLDYLKSLVSPVSEKEERKPAEEKKGKAKLRSDMPSLVTQSYFDNSWDELELEGNEGIKDAIKKQILKIEKKHDSKYKEAAKIHGITVEEYKQELQNCVEELISKSEFFRATHSEVIEKVFNESGRFKTQFEPGIRSDGVYDKKGRASTENKFFGFKQDIDHDIEKRPVYGYFSTDNSGIINRGGHIPPPNYVNGYGDVCIKIKKDSAHRKATFTIRDSLSGSHICAATPVAKSHFTSLGDVDLSRIREILKAGPGNFSDNYGYTECQYHNQLTTDDIDSLHIHTKLYGKELRDKDGHFVTEKVKGKEAIVIHEIDYDKVNTVVESMYKFAAKSGKDIKIKLH